MPQEKDYHDAGIDWGRLSNVNRDKENNIRFGVIPFHEVTQVWADESEAEYTPTCPNCGNELTDLTDDNESDMDYFCPNCGVFYTTEDDIWPEQPDSFYYNKDGYEIVQNGDDVDLFVVKSPYYTYAANCSPCAPGAGYITQTVKPNENQKTYCLGHDWFEAQETGKWINCKYCDGTGLRKKKDIPNYDENRFKDLLFDDNQVYCWNCHDNLKYGCMGMVKDYIQKAPYPVYSVETSKLVEPIKE